MLYYVDVTDSRSTPELGEFIRQQRQRANLSLRRLADRAHRADHAQHRRDDAEGRQAAGQALQCGDRRVRRNGTKLSAWVAPARDARADGARPARGAVSCAALHDSIPARRHPRR